MYYTSKFLYIYNIPLNSICKDIFVGIEFSTINSNLSGIDVYVGTDEKLHFVDSTGADSALLFSKEVLSSTTTVSGKGSYDTGHEVIGAVVILQDIVS